MRENDVVVKISGGRSYSILTGSDLQGEIVDSIRDISSGGRTLVVTDRNVARIYLDEFVKSVKKSGSNISAEILPSGESRKNFAAYRRLIDRLAEIDDRRDLMVVAFGGGVVGDLAGFAAATYRRGIPLIQVPTTLLACVDSSVGGKTGFDLPQGKNLVGSFYQPKKVVVDTNYLASLPKRELRAGMAEVIKYGVIMDAQFLCVLKREMNELLNRDTKKLSSCIQKCCRLKAQVVSQDEHDTNDVRAILNFGHTFAHAIETACGYRRYRHGEAVGVGMVCAADLSARLGLLKRAECVFIEEIVKMAGLPTTISGAEPDAIVRFMSKDKKTKSGKLRFVLIDGIGHAFVSEAPTIPEVKTVLIKRMA